MINITKAAESSIAEVAKQVLVEVNKPMSLFDIHDIIIKNSLYLFKEGVNSEHILRSQINRKCINSNLTYKNKKIIFYFDENEKKYGLLDWLSSEELQNYVDDDDYQEILKETIKDNKDEIEYLSNKLEKFEAKYEKFHELIEEAEEAEKLFLSSKKSFDEQSKLLASKNYWDDKKKSHFWFSIALFIVFLIMTGLTIYATVELMNNWNPILKNDENASSILKSVDLSQIGKTFISLSIAIWVSRIVLKIFLSNLHLYEESKERVTMLLTYLALINEGKLDENDRNVIVNALFRPSSSGIIQDDTNVTLVDIVNILKKR